MGCRRQRPGFELWRVHFAIMLSYVAGQGLIAWGTVNAARRAAPATAPERVLVER